MTTVTKRALIEGELLKNSGRSNREIARAIGHGVDHKTVAATRVRCGSALRLSMVADCSSPAELVKAVPNEPPVPLTTSVLARLNECRRALADLEGQVPEVAFASAMNGPGARRRLAELGQHIADLKFEIGAAVKAEHFASVRDNEAMAAWHEAVQRLPPAEIVAGITSGKFATDSECCRRCSSGRCVITAGDRTACGACAHPVRSGPLHAQFHGNPQVQAVYAAACAKTGTRR